MNSDERVIVKSLEEKEVFPDLIRIENIKYEVAKIYSTIRYA